MKTGKNRSAVDFRPTASGLVLLLLLALAIMVSGQPAPVASGDGPSRMNPAVRDSFVNDTIRHTPIDSAAPPTEPQSLPVTADILSGVWKGKDSSGSEISFSFSIPGAQQPFIYGVVVQFGKSAVTGKCTLMENNLDELMLSTPEIQDIRTMWSMSYDGTVLTITDIGDHVIGGLKTFRLKKAVKNGE